MICFLFVIVTLVVNAEAVDKNKYVMAAEAIVCWDYNSMKNFKDFYDQQDKQALVRLMADDCMVVGEKLNVFIVQEKGEAARIRREGMTDSLWTLRMFLR
jgi:hypothetical protein